MSNNKNQGGPGGDGGMDVLTFGMMQALRTGNPAFDLLVVVLVPLVMAMTTALAVNIRPWMSAFWSRAKRLGRKEYMRTVRRSTKIGRWDPEESDKDKYNHILQKAVSLYLATERESRLRKSKHASIVLTAIGKEKCSGKYSWNKSYGNTSEQLEQYACSMRLPENVWVEVDDGVDFRLVILDEDNEEEGDGNKNGGNNNSEAKLVTDFEFRSTWGDGKERVSKFLNDAFHWYQQQVASQTDRSRYLYMMQVPGKDAGAGGDDDDDDEGGGGPAYKRYKLSDNKTFESLFFPQKAVLLDLLDNFTERRGKFAIPGFPHKLGLLLHGPPGTGKTSLIKALAQHTGRSVVSVPLGRIKVRLELSDCNFDV